MRRMLGWLGQERTNPEQCAQYASKLYTILQGTNTIKYPQSLHPSLGTMACESPRSRQELVHTKNELLLAETCIVGNPPQLEGRVAPHRRLPRSTYRASIQRKWPRKKTLCPACLMFTTSIQSKLSGSKA